MFYKIFKCSVEIPFPPCLAMHSLLLWFLTCRPIPSKPFTCQQLSSPLFALQSCSHWDSHSTCLQLLCSSQLQQDICLSNTITCGWVITTRWTCCQSQGLAHPHPIPGGMILAQDKYWHPSNACKVSLESQPQVQVPHTPLISSLVDPAALCPYCQLASSHSLLPHRTGTSPWEDNYPPRPSL